MAVVKRVRRALDGGAAPSSAGAGRGTRGLPLAARVAALSTGGDDGGGGGGGGGGGDEVVVLGTGRAIEKTLNVAAWFDRQKDCRVSLRTRTIGAVDDVVVGRAEDAGDEEEDGDGEGEEGDHARVRMVSCLEVVVRLR